MWTLLMDQGDNALWNLLAAKFVTPLALAASYAASPPTSWSGGQDPDLRDHRDQHRQPDLERDRRQPRASGHPVRD